MSVEDMQYVEKLTSKRSRPSSKQVSDDDIPLGISRESTVSKSNASRGAPLKKVPKIDWFDFFLSAGCDLDDCTRYAASFERDKIDESILPDITDATMRSLGLREGDIIRVSKAIEKRRPTDNLRKPSGHTEEQVRRDEELAKQLQAQETGGSVRNPAPNLFAGPGGVLKNPRRGRPQPSKTLPPSNVDLKAISTVSDQISRTASPASAHPLTPVQPPVRSSSAIPVVSGFDDDAWTNRPSSTKPLVGTPPSNAPRAPSAPPTAASTAPPPAPSIAPLTPTAPAPQVLPTPAPQVLPSPAPAPSASPALSTSSSLARTTESDIFNQLSRLSALRQPTASQPVAPPASRSAPPVSNQNMSVSPAPISQFTHNPQITPQPYNSPRGPFAPVPANQGLLQPLIPTQTGFNSFISTRPTQASHFAGPQQQSSFLAPQPTQPLISHPTGIPIGNFNPVPYQNPFNPIQTRM